MCVRRQRYTTINAGETTRERRKLLDLARRAQHTLLLEVGGKRLNNALIAAPPRSHLIRLALHYFDQHICGLRGVDGANLGPSLLTQA